MGTIRFAEANEYPEQFALKGMNHETEAIINKIKAAKDQYLIVTLTDKKDAQRRIESVRRAKERKQVNFEESSRKGNKLCFKLR